MLIVRFYSSFAACSEHVYSEHFQKSSEPLHDKENRLLRTQEREREPDVRQKQPSKGRKD